MDTLYSGTMHDYLARRADMRDGYSSLVATAYSLAALATLCVLLRFLTNYKEPYRRISLDDWLALAAGIVVLPCAFIIDFGLVRNGLGKDIWTLQPQQITDVLMYFHTLAWLYFLCTTLVKLAMISYYSRIYTGGRTQRVLWITFGFTAAWGIAFVLVAVFQCYPIDYFWTGWDGVHAGSCRNANAIAWSNAASNIGLELWIMAVPLWKLRGVHLHWKKKIRVSFAFSVGAFVTVMSALRCHSLVSFARSTNSTADFYSICLWSTIELTTGVVCACLPSIWPLWAKLHPRAPPVASLSREDGMYHRATSTVVAQDDLEAPSQGIRVLHTYTVLNEEGPLK